MTAPTRYSPVSMAFHWMIALTVLATAAIGIWHSGMGYYDPWAPSALWLHRVIGVSAFTLLALKLLWRLFDGAPPLEPGLSRLERIAAKATHHTLTLAVLAIPVTGYLVSTSKGGPVPLVWGLDLPATLRLGNEASKAAMQAHEVMAYGLLGLVALHVAAALKHQFLDGGQTLRRMLPGRSTQG